MRKILIRRLGVASIAKFTGAAYAIIGAVIGFLAMFGGVASVLVNESWDAFTKVFASLGVVVVSLIVVPLLSFLWGWLYGAVLALIANLFLQTARGIELDVEDGK